MRRGAFRATPVLSHRRAILGLSQDQFGRKAGVSCSMIGMVETGQRAASPGMAKKIAKALGYTLEKAVEAGVFMLNGTP